VDLDSLTELVLDPGLPAPLIYTILFLGCLLESFFPPWPADVITMYMGFLAGRGILAPAGVLAVAVVGTQTGVMGAFWVGRRWGPSLFTGRLARFLPIGQLGQIEAWFARYGAPAIAVSRFFPGIRALVTPAAGLAGFAAWKVWVFAGTSVVLWNVFVVGVGLVAGQQLEWAKQILVRYNTVAGALLVVVVAGLVGLAIWRRYRR
jgi:membrane-associated protein